jgi:sensor histidine kinase YesM
VILREELFLVGQYLAIEQVRFGDRLRVKVDHAPEAPEVNVPRLLLQPLVENAIRHGIAPRPEGAEILISSSFDHDMLMLRVLNDCPDPAYLDATGNGRTGVGIANTKSRLKTFYGKNQHLEIARRSGKFEVTISIPIVHPVGTFDRRETATTP